MKTFRDYITEADFDIKKFIESCKKQKAAFDESDNKEGSKFLDGILASYEKNGSLSPAQVQAAAKFMKS